MKIKWADFKKHLNSETVIHFDYVTSDGNEIRITGGEYYEVPKTDGNTIEFLGFSYGNSGRLEIRKEDNEEIEVSGKFLTVVRTDKTTSVITIYNPTRFPLDNPKNAL